MTGIEQRPPTPWISKMQEAIESHGFNGLIFMLPKNRDYSENDEASVVPAGLHPAEVLEILIPLLFHIAKADGIPLEEVTSSLEQDVKEMGRCIYNGAEPRGRNDYLQNLN